MNSIMTMLAANGVVVLCAKTYVISNSLTHKCMSLNGQMNSSHSNHKLEDQLCIIIMEVKGLLFVVEANHRSFVFV